MARLATPLTLSSEEEQTLRQWVQAHKTERRMVERARIVLLAAAGSATTAIARQLDTPPVAGVEVAPALCRAATGGPRRPASFGQAGAL